VSDSKDGGESQGHLESDQLGGEAFVVDFRSDVLTVSSSRPQPPGTRLALAEPGDGGNEIQGKVTDVSATTAGRWEVKVKLFAPSKKARQRLEELLESRDDAGHGVGSAHL
jgi:hypothetical protein